MGGGGGGVYLTGGLVFLGARANGEGGQKMIRKWSNMGDVIYAPTCKIWISPVVNRTNLNILK